MMRNDRIRALCHAALLCATIALCGVSAAGEAFATEFSDLGRGLTPDHDADVELSGAFRLRGERLHNLDLDRGLTPSGVPLYPVPLADPDAQTLHHSDMRLRTDLSMYAPFGSVRVNMRVDVVDNLTLGSTPLGTPLTTTTQWPDAEAQTNHFMQLKRVWGEALTPFGVIAAGRMGNTWGTGMLSNGGDCVDCDSGDAADRLAFVTTQQDHFIAVAYDVGWRGPVVARKVPTRSLDIEPSDNMHTFTAAILRQRDAIALDRRTEAGKATFDYGAVYSFRRQRNDFPLEYVPTEEEIDSTTSQVVGRGYRAHVADVWLRLVAPAFRVEAEVAVLSAHIEEASLIPGVRYDVPLTSLQYGGVVLTEVGRPEGRVSGGFDFGLASGDGAPGFGATPAPNQGPGLPGDLDGAQVNPPFDTAANNFRFHPDFRIDQILFREILGTVTDAVYVRPHARVDLWRSTAGKLTFKLSGVASQALYATSTPGGANALGVEIDPSLDYVSRDKFRLGLDYAALFPLAGLDNMVEGLPARPAQLLRLRMVYGF